MRLLLVEDEIRLADALVYILKKNKYSVDAVHDGLSGLEMAETGIYDVIILDRMLPGMNGIEILKSIRNSGMTTPVLFLTAMDTISDRVIGLDNGADDYLVKPFATDELLARIRALGRRNSDTLMSDNIAISTLVFSPLKCEIENNGLTSKLTLKESQLLELFLRNKNQVITREQILDRVWGIDSDVEINSIEVYLSYLRKKLSSVNSDIHIDTIRGVGYCIKEG